ncbi:uncharacterized protein CIMG_03004 [Coccidioides immitis RS]|uniref:Transcription initiation factor TFIID subunit 4 n=1 Tax=Coccidioides immitis (strain RS) TaxID=246410 RepID=J3KAE2_COCIM|nr:uncharacterized protein CIMG_03004 [Coccidioides immitis RS]EAS31980.3 hypothetical protein CIMG_03004 [Coccidioides immitis RS]
MAQTQSHQFPSQSSFSPPASTPSPSPSSTGTPSGNLGPPPKRQRLSPLPQTQAPFSSSPGFGTLQLPQTTSPVNGVPVANMTNPPGNAVHPPPQPQPQPQPQTHTPQPPPPPGSMGPPSRPAETKPTDAAELTDVLASSGIDVREEEAFLTSGYGAAPATTPQPPPRIQTNITTSFTSLPSAGSTPSAGNSFTEPAFKQAHYQPPPTAAGAQPVPRKSPEELAADAKLRDDTVASRRDQYPLHAPFLQTAPLGERLQKRGNELGIRMPSGGFFRPFPNRPATPIEIVGPDGQSVIRTGKPVLTTDAPLGDIISLMSLACEERLRSVVEHSAVLAQNRRAYSHGVVPQEWNDLAEGNNQKKGKEDQNGIAAASPNGTSQKRTISTNRDDSNEARRITFPNTLAMKSRRLIEKDGSYEEGRANKRMKRNTDAILSGDTGRSASVGPGAEPSGERAPDVEKKTKKELKKAEAKVNDAVQHQHAVETARMATGGLSTSRFGGKKTYSWLSNPSATSASRTSFSNPSRARPGGGSAPSGTGKPGGLSNGIRVPPGKRLGEWREDKDRGAGVQIRDILFMLELDGKAAKHLQKAYSKESKEEVDRPGK